MFIADLKWYKKLSGLRSFYLARKVSDYLNDNSLILDFGCGNMYTARKILEFKPGCKIVGLDIVADQNLDLSDSNERLSFVESGDQRCPFDDNSFDHVLALACLHHTEYPEKYVEELKRIVKPGGSIIIAEEMYINALDKLYISGSDYLLNKMKEGIPVPLNFRSHQHYQKVFKYLDLKVLAKSNLRLFPNFMHHYIYVLRKGVDQLTS